MIFSCIKKKAVLGNILEVFPTILFFSFAMKNFQNKKRQGLTDKNQDNSLLCYCKMYNTLLALENAQGIYALN